jgi:3-oxocholest-4-en-26-oyl-CoA dehydrogenase alpha subunit
MDFGFSKEEELFRAEIREFVRDNIPADRPVSMLDEGQTDEDWAFIMSISKKLAQRKWLTISWPKAHGGMEASHMKRLVFDEEVSYWGIPGTSMGISGTAWVGPSLMIFGTDEQREKYLPPIAKGDENGVWCTGYSEPDSGSDLASMQTFAEKVGDEYVLNGQKVWTSVAHHARWMWLAARTKRDVQKKQDGISLFLVDMQSPGLKVSPLKNFVGGHVFNEVFFTDVKIPAKNLVGVENQGWAQLMTALSFERGMVAGSFAYAKRIVDELVEYAKETGRISDPPVRTGLAELAIEVERGLLLARESVWKAHCGKTVIYEPSRDKTNGDELLEKISKFGTQLLGAYAMMDPQQPDNQWTRLKGMLENAYYMSVGMSVAAGTTDVNRNITAKFGLQLPKS